MIKIFLESDKFSHKAGVTKHAANTLARKSLICRNDVLCCEYAKEYDITFKPKITVCIQFGSKINIDEHVSMNGFTVQ